MLENTPRRVLIEVDITQRNTYRFDNGTELIMFPKTNEFDRRKWMPVSGLVISSDSIPCQSEILVEHNSLEPVNAVVEYENSNPNIKMYSVPEMECYAWRLPDQDRWHATKYYAIAERLFKPYAGILQNIKPERIKNTLLILSGELKGNVVHILKDGEYEIIYQDRNGKPNQLLVTFNAPAEEIGDMVVDAKQEVIAIDYFLTEKWLNGELYAGLTPDHAKPYEYGRHRTVAAAD